MTITRSKTCGVRRHHNTADHTSNVPKRTRSISVATLLWRRPTITLHVYSHWNLISAVRTTFYCPGSGSIGCHRTSHSTVWRQEPTHKAIPQWLRTPLRFYIWIRDRSLQHVAFEPFQVGNLLWDLFCILYGPTTSRTTYFRSIRGKYTRCLFLFSAQRSLVNESFVFISDARSCWF